MTDQDRAREIMGANFLGTEDVRRHFGVAYAEEQLRHLTDVPFGQETLQACKDTHVLVAGAALSVNDIRAFAESDFYGPDWYRREAFASDKKVGVRWYLLRKGPVPGSRNKTYDQQTALLRDEEVPFACEVTYMAILYGLTLRDRLLQGVYVRCRDKDSDGNRVHVGRFVSDRFDVNDYWDDDRLDRLGLASSVVPRMGGTSPLEALDAS